MGFAFVLDWYVSDLENKAGAKLVVDNVRKLLERYGTPTAPSKDAGTKGVNVTDVLDMTTSELFGFARGAVAQGTEQKKLPPSSTNAGANNDLNLAVGEAEEEKETSAMYGSGDGGGLVARREEFGTKKPTAAKRTTETTLPTPPTPVLHEGGQHAATDSAQRSKPGELAAPGERRQKMIDFVQRKGAGKGCSLGSLYILLLFQGIGR